MRPQVGLCALGRLLVLVLATTLVDAQLRCAHFQHQSEEVRARAYDELGGHISRASSAAELGTLGRCSGPPSAADVANAASPPSTPDRDIRGEREGGFKSDGRRGAMEMV